MAAKDRKRQSTEQWEGDVHSDDDWTHMSIESGDSTATMPAKSGAPGSVFSCLSGAMLTR